jgi:Protein of unknown function (DUF2785)
MTRFAPLLVSLLLMLPAHSQPRHGTDFWRNIATHGFAPPEGERTAALAHELSKMLASTDPELRDDLAYSILGRWIARPGILEPQTLNDLTDEWRTNFNAPGADAVLLRSFSALCLASMARRELRTPFMGPDRYHALVTEAIAYLQEEKDLRGWDPQLGWVHATAHTSDLLAALAANPQLSKEEESAILTAIGRRLSSAPRVYTQGEQDRLAVAVNAVVRRADFDQPLFDKWLEGLETEDAPLWKNPLTEESLAVYQNHNYMLQALSVHLALETETPAILSLRTKVLNLLRKR